MEDVKRKIEVVFSRIGLQKIEGMDESRRVLILKMERGCKGEAKV